MIYCGQLLVLERGIKVDAQHVPLTFGRRTSVVNGMSESGNFLGRIVLSEFASARQSSSVSLRSSTGPASTRSLSAAQEIPFFWAWAPVDYPLDTGYAWMTDNPVPEVSPDHRRIALTFSMAGIA